MDDVLDRLKGLRPAWNTLTEDLQREIRRLRNNRAVMLQDGLTEHADMFWNAEQPDVRCESIGEAMEDHCSGEIAEIGRAVTLPPLYVVLVATDDGDEFEKFTSLSAAQAFVARMKSPPDAA